MRLQKGDESYGGGEEGSAKTAKKGADVVLVYIGRCGHRQPPV